MLQNKLLVFCSPFFRTLSKNIYKFQQEEDLLLLCLLSTFKFQYLIAGICEHLLYVEPNPIWMCR